MKNLHKRNHLFSLSLTALLFATYSCQKEEVSIVNDSKEEVEVIDSTQSGCFGQDDIRGIWHWQGSFLLTGGDLITAEDSDDKYRFEFAETTVKKYHNDVLVYESDYIISVEELLNGTVGELLIIAEDPIEMSVGFNGELIVFIDQIEEAYVHHYVNEY